MKVLLALCLTFVGAAVADVDYCAAGLCKAGVVHVACNSNKGFAPAPACVGANQVDLTGELQQLIVDRHNMRRSEVATGNLTGFPTASKMLEMSWDNDLAYIAGFNARQCVMKHDACRSTKAYPYAGQNLATVGLSNRFTENKAAIIQMLDMWYAENKNCPPELVSAFGPTKDTVGHFTAMIQQKSGRIGCALTQYMQGKWYMSLLACNYQYTNMLKEEIYSIGLPCSKCTGKCSTTNPGLCV